MLPPLDKSFLTSSAKREMVSSLYPDTLQSLSATPLSRNGEVQDDIHFSVCQADEYFNELAKGSESLKYEKLDNVRVTPDLNHLAGKPATGSVECLAGTLSPHFEQLSYSELQTNSNAADALTEQQSLLNLDSSSSTSCLTSLESLASNISTSPILDADFFRSAKERRSAGKSGRSPRAKNGGSKRKTSKSTKTGKDEQSLATAASHEAGASGSISNNFHNSQQQSYRSHNAVISADSSQVPSNAVKKEAGQEYYLVSVQNLNQRHRCSGASPPSLNDLQLADSHANTITMNEGPVYADLKTLTSSVQSKFTHLCLPLSSTILCHEEKLVIALQYKIELLNTTHLQDL